MTDGSGDVYDRRDFFPFGEQIPANSTFSNRQYVTGYNGSNQASDHMFTGKERDEESGLDYFGTRYYAPSIGRFASPDPVAISGFLNPDDPQAWNGYSYVRNSPLRLIDPNGDTFVEVCVDGGRCFFIDDGELDKQASGSPGVTLEDGKIFSSVDGEKTQVGTYRSAFGDDGGSTATDYASAAFVVSQLDSPAPGPADFVALAIAAVGVMEMGANKHNQAVLEGLFGQAALHIGKLSSHPPNDPDRPGWKREVKAALDRATRVAKRLPGKAQQKALDVIRSMEKQLEAL